MLTDLKSSKLILNHQCFLSSQYSVIKSRPIDTYSGHIAGRPLTPTPRSAQSRSPSPFKRFDPTEYVRQKEIKTSMMRQRSASRNSPSLPPSIPSSPVSSAKGGRNHRLKKSELYPNLPQPTYREQANRHQRKAAPVSSGPSRRPRSGNHVFLWSFSRWMMRTFNSSSFMNAAPQPKDDVDHRLASLQKMLLSLQTDI